MILEQLNNGPINGGYGAGICFELSTHRAVGVGDRIDPATGSLIIDVDMLTFDRTIDLHVDCATVFRTAARTLTSPPASVASAIHGQCNTEHSRTIPATTARAHLESKVKSESSGFVRPSNCAVSVPHNRRPDAIPSAAASLRNHSVESISAAHSSPGKE
ncbi:hypothetical protein [Rhodococcus sp. 2G]|uniref:hypothetical protein n=1 Tax=Rhodococcus sp. 2G TaxID=1570939 RepID=UPI0012EB2CEA|nr:hypothetical protein [Rhodococcus sp. 2G]